MALKQKHFIDSHKCVTVGAILGLMTFYDAWDNPTAWVYLALHGTYGLLWALKSVTFGDRQWEQPTGIAYGLYIWAGLTLYWITPWIIVAWDVRAPPWLIGATVAVYSFGIFFHFASDMQKDVNLKLNPGKLFCDGLWSRCRNPNYFGELLIYGGFSALAMHWAPYAVLALFLAVIWIPNMIRKEKMLKELEGYVEWKKRSSLFIPFVL